MERKTILSVLLVASVIALGGMSAYVLSLSRSATPSANTSVQGETHNGIVYPDCITQVNTVLDQGYEINTFLSSSSTKVGDILCVNIILLNIDGRNLTQSSSERLSLSYNITESDGALVYQKSCVATPSNSNSTTSASTIVSSLSCTGYWDTGQAFGGVTPTAGTYTLTIDASIPYEVVQGMYEASSVTQIALTG